MMSEASALELFDRLQAEYERPWLDEVFVPPTGFAGLLGMRSVAIFGTEGGGKTALQLRLTHDAQATGRLVVDWKPSVLDGVAGSRAVLAYMRQVMGAWAVTLLHYIGQYPGRFERAPDWAKEVLVWIVRERLPGRWGYYTSRWQRELKPEGHRLLERLADIDVDMGFPASISDGQLIEELTAVVPELGVTGTWLVVDGAQPWLLLDEEDLLAMFQDITATLAYFEQPGLAWRFFLPQSFNASLSRSGAITRRRVDRYQLHWSEEQLEDIAVRRLQIAFDQDTISLASLVDGEQMLAYLQRYGGQTPRGWLDLLRPFVVAYQRLGAERPLTTTEWEQARLYSAPKLRILPDKELVMIGTTPVEGLSASLKRVLFYLYNDSDRRCTRSELYFIAYRQLEREYGSVLEAGDDWEHADDWGPALDTVLWRLRKAVEWNTRQPVYIFSERGERRGQGEVWLQNVL